jgi:hypothetical protein
MTFKHLSIAILLAGTLLTSCKKESATGIADTNEQAHKKETVFSQFLNSLDPLTVPQRKEAIRSFLSQYHSQNNKENVNVRKNTNNAGNRVQDEYDDVIQYEIINTETGEGQDISNPPLDGGSNIDPDWYNDTYESVNVTGKTRRVTWMLVKQIAHLWRVMSEEQFVTRDQTYPKRFTSGKHISSYLLGVTSFVTWTETFNEIGESDAGYNMYSNTKGTLNFNFPGDFPSFTTSVENVAYFSADAIF